MPRPHYEMYAGGDEGLIESSGEMVRHRRPPEGLLQGVSRDGEGRQPETHHDLRRERDWLAQMEREG